MFDMDYGRARRQVKMAFWGSAALALVFFSVPLSIGVFYYRQTKATGLFIIGIFLYFLVRVMIGGISEYGKRKRFIDTAEKLGIRVNDSLKRGGVSSWDSDYEKWLGVADGEYQSVSRVIRILYRQELPPRQFRDPRFHFFSRSFEESGSYRMMTSFEMDIPDKDLNLVFRHEKGSNKMLEKIANTIFRESLEKLERLTLDMGNGWIGTFWSEKVILEASVVKEKLAQFCSSDFWERVEKLPGRHVVIFQNGKLRIVALGFKCQEDELKKYFDVLPKLVK